jgi:hypothetical protein
VVLEEEKESTMFFTSELAHAHIADLLSEAEQARRVNLARPPRVRRRKWSRHEEVHSTRHEETTVYCRRAAGHALVHGGAR